MSFLGQYICNTDTNIMKYGLYVLRKILCSMDLFTEKAKLINEMVTQPSVIQYIGSLLNFPDDTVKVKIHLFTFSMNQYGL